MRILLAVDEHPYSAHASKQVARLAVNTWADITLLGLPTRSNTVQDTLSVGGREDVAFNEILEDYKKTVTDQFGQDNSPYHSLNRPDDAKATDHANRFQKKFVTKIRTGHIAKEILQEADASGIDLIVLGGSTERGYDWETAGNVPLKVARDAGCSVLVVKEDKKIGRVLCCLDHDMISQKSLEMVSQMVTLFHADLEIVVLIKREDMQDKIETKLDWLLKHYTASKINTWIELVKLSSLEKFISQQSRWGLMAMWLGKKSVLELVFPSSKISKLLKANESSVLLLR